MLNSSDILQPRPNGYLALFRLAFGAILTLRIAWYLASGNVDYLANTQILFDFPGFGWLPELPGPAYRWLLIGLIPFALTYTAGVMFRLSAAVLTVGWGLFFFADMATWGNLDYLIAWFLLLSVFIPADSRLSHTLRWRPGNAYRSAPIWVLWILRFQLGVVYFFAGVVKIDAGWLSGRTFEYFVAVENHNPMLAGLLNWPAFAPMMAWSGMFFDLLIVPAMLWRPTAKLAFPAMIFFHVFNYVFIGLGTIPPVMIVLTLVVFLPTQTTEGICQTLETMLGFEPPRLDWPTPIRSRTAVAGVLAVVLVQTALPLRHFLYPGDARWHQQGQVYSWWLRTVHSDVHVKFYATYRGSDGEIAIAPLDYIDVEQKAMAIDPQMLVEFAHHVADSLRAQGKTDVRVVADITKALNRGERYRFLPRDLDLSRVPRETAGSKLVLERSKETYESD